MYGPADHRQHQGPQGEVNSVINGFEGRGSGLKYDQNTIFADQRQMLNVNASDVDIISQMTGSKSVMIRQRGRFPKTLWQPGALQTNKKSRQSLSRGWSAAKKHTIKRKFGMKDRDQSSMLQPFNRTGTMSELNRLTHGSFANMNAYWHQKKHYKDQQIKMQNSSSQLGQALNSTNIKLKNISKDDLL